MEKISSAFETFLEEDVPIEQAFDAAGSES